MGTTDEHTGLDVEAIVRPPIDTVRILHVDDDADFLDLTATFLEREREQFDVITELSAAAGLDRLAEADIDCIVSDYDMPGKDGLDFLEDVRAEYPDLPFILFTGKGSEEIASEAIAAGVTDYLRKGGGTERYTLLANRIMNAIDRYYANQQMVRGFKAMDTAREGISLLDEEGYFLYVNEAFAETVGYSRRDLIHKHWEFLYPAENVSLIYDEILPTVPVEGRWSGVTTYVRQDGSRIQVDHALSHTEDGTMICLIQELPDGKSPTGPN